MVFLMIAILAESARAMAHMSEVTPLSSPILINFP